MPNGHPNFSSDEIEAWFAPLAEELAAFASSHNLLVDKYYHGSPCWTFRFNHPKGGQTSVRICLQGPDAAGVGSVWHVDDYDRFTRYLHWRKDCIVKKVAKEVRSALEAELVGILAVPFGQWNQVADRYQAVWSRYTKEEFARLAPKLPDVVP